MKFKSICLSSMLIYGLYIGTAQPEAVLTSKAYVDNKVPAYASGGSPSLLTDTTTTGTIAKRAIFTDGTTYVAGTHANQIPTMGAVMSAVSSGSQSPIPAGSYGANNSLVTYDDTAGTVQERWILGEGTEEMEDDPAVGTIFYASRLRTDFSGDNFGTLADGDMTAITKTEAEESLVPAKIISKALLSKQDNIPGHAANAADSLLTDSATSGTVQKRAIFTDGTTYVAGTHANQIPTMGAVMSAISSDSQSPIPAGTNGYLATHSGSEGTFGTPVNPATFQTAITTGLVNFKNGVADLPAITTYDTTGGLVANKIGILDQETIADDEGYLGMYSSAGSYGAEMDNYVPTVRAVAEGLQIVENMNAPLPWNTAEQNATGAYSTTFAASGTNVWPSADQSKVVKGQTFANAMATKQNKIPARATKIDAGDSIFANSVVTNGTTDGDVGQMAILTAGYNGGDPLSEWIGADSIIPTMGAVADALQPLPWNTAEQNATGAYNTTFANSGTNVWPTADAYKVVKGQTFANAMATKQNKIPMATTPTGLYTDGSVVTHTNSDGIVGEKHIIDDQMFDELLEGRENWNSEYRNMLITAGSVYNGLSTKQNKIVGHAANAADSVLTDSTTAGVVNKRAIYDGSTTYAAATDANKIPTAGFVATKQNKILTDLVNFDDEDVRAIIATNADGTALTGDTVGIVSSTNMNHSLGSVEYWDDPTLGEWVNLNNFVPDISVIQGVAGLVNEKQNKIAGYNPNNDEEKSLLTDTTTDGVVGKMMIRNSDSNAGEALNYWAQDDIIPTLGAIADAIQSLPWNTREQNATAAYSTTFAYNGSNVWPTDDTYRFVEGTTFANALAVKQNKISGHAANAADSLLTDSATDGTVQKRAIFTDGTTYVAGTHANQIPTMGAVMSAVSAGTNAVDVSSHTVNGAPLSNSASYFYGTSSTAAATTQKEVSIPSITSLAAGQIIVVQPSATSTVANSTLKLNDFAAYPMRYNGAAITTSTDAVVWNQTHPSVWLFDGTYWVFMGDTNSTYGSMSVEEGVAGTAQSGRVLRADYLKRIIQGTTLTGLSTSDATAVAATDSITTGIGKLQAQITNKQSKATCTEYKPNSNNTICYAYTFADISASQPGSKTPVSDPIEEKTKQ